MADTKQATPDECMRIGCGLPAAHLVHNRPSIGEYPIINYHDFVASRSGPKQATPECTCGDIYGGFPAGEPEPNQLDSTCPVHGNKLASRSGPDRTPPQRERLEYAKDFREKEYGSGLMFHNGHIDYDRVDELMVAFARADRGQQDAPDIEELVRKYESSAMYCKADHAAQTKAESRINIRAALKEFGAKAAREGQAPTGDTKGKF